MSYSELYEQSYASNELTVSYNGPNNSFTTSNLQIVNCREPATLFWSYPKKTMIVKFYADENASVPFKLHLLKTNDIYEDIQLYHIGNNEERQVTKSDAPITINSNSTDNTVTIKAVGPDCMKYYGAYVHFQIE